jgi:hypothetical protein
MKKILLSILLLSPIFGFSQNLLTETFDYTVGGLVTGAGGKWITYSGTAGSSTTTAGSLTYTGYTPGNIGNKAAIIKGSSEDVKTLLSTPQTSGKIYSSFLINVTAATSGGDYFFHFTQGTSLLKGRVFIKTNVAGFDIGLQSDSQQSGGGVPAAIGYTTNAYTFGTTYLIVLSYEFKSGTNDDVVSLWINPDLTGAEPTPNLGPFVISSDFTSLEAISLRQGSSTTTPDLSVDGIKIGTTWANSVLPITLTSFTGKESNNSILLNWITASEKNNKNFEILRSTDGKSFKNIGTVDGAGDSDTQKDYSFTDANPFGGTNYYQLKQIDFDGRNSNSAIIAVNSKIATAQLSVYAEASTVNIKITSPNETAGKIALFDITGRKLREQSIHLNKGYNVLQLNETLSPGLHFINLTTDGEVVKYKFIKQ